MDLKQTIFSTLTIFYLLLKWSVEANTTICTHCCDEVFPKNDTPIYYMLKGPKGNMYCKACMFEIYGYKIARI